MAVVVESDLSLPKDIDSVRLTVTQNGQVVRDETHPVGPMGLLLPAEFRLQPIGDAPASIRVLGYKGEQARVERTAIMPIPATYLALLRMPLNFLCVGTARSDGSSTCGDMQTCKQGACLPALVDYQLPAYQEGPWTGAETGTRDAAASDCFDVLSCFGDSNRANLNRQTCSLMLAQDDPGHISVGIKLPQGSDGICGGGSCWIALDEGPEGWTQSGLTLMLPPTLCAERPDGTRFTVVVTNACAGKTLSTPPCGDWSSATHPAELDQPTGSTSSPSMSMETPPELVGPACAGTSLQACGDCGTQRRTCKNGVWSEWGECTSQGVCSTNAIESCGSEGMRTCENTCEWGECTGQTCEGMAVQACGNCGTQRRECTNGVWSEWGLCLEQGECSPGTTQICGSGGLQGCMGNCHWGVCGNQLCPGAPSQACGNCGTQTRSCDAGTATWSAWGPCAQEGACEANATRTCGSRGLQTCGGSCQWDAACTGQVCDGPATRACGNCGTQARTCNTSTGVWSEWGLCLRQGACAPGSMQGCGAGGTHTCLETCQWSEECSGQACAGAMTQSCAKCGTQSRECNSNTAQWLPFGQCTNQGACTPGATRTCGAGGTQICKDDCKWATECTGQACTGPSSEPCGNCGTRTHTCNGSTGMWGEWSACRGEGCKPNDVQACGTTSQQTCTAACKWGSCECTGNLTSCDGACVDTKTDEANCGACKTACADKHDCNNGKCDPCARDQMQCDGRCTDVNTDAANCGRCGRGCTGGRVCIGGTCSCPDGECSSQCVDTSSDEKNCHSCGTECGTGQMCVSGSCMCPNGQLFCGGRCTTCPAPSGATGVCNAGACAVDCGTKRYCANDNVCADTKTDEGHCGDQCVKCGTGQTCDNGSCKCGTNQLSCEGKCLTCTAPSGGHAVCNGDACGVACDNNLKYCARDNTCANTNTDEGHCGNDCVQCGTGQTCESGSCKCGNGQLSCGGKCITCSAPTGGTAVCADGSCGVNCGSLTYCPKDDVCANTQSDAKHCGSSCTACGTGEICDKGMCKCDDGQLACGGKCLTCSAPTGGHAVCTAAGTCGVQCDGGKNYCARDNSCANTDGDATHCGASCEQCGSGETCDNGTCKCGGGTLACGGKCLTCPAPTGGHAVCANGSCGVQCDGGKNYCSKDDFCADTNGDETHCGASCTKCPTGQTCNSGSCGCATSDLCGPSCVKCTPPTTGGTAVCEGNSCGVSCNLATPTYCKATNSCVNTSSDENNCGGCGIRCDGTCTAGSCKADEPPDAGIGIIPARNIP